MFKILPLLLLAVSISGPPVIDIDEPPSTAAGGSYRGPGDTAPAGGGTVTGGGGPRPGGGGASGPTTRPGPNGPGGSTGRPSSTGSTMPGAPRPVTLVTTSDDTWWLWWEYNKNEFLRPNRLTLADAPMTGDDAESNLRSAILRARVAALLVFEGASSDPDANLRATGAIALGRVGRASVVPRLLAMLDDPNLDVRHKAILGLGATGADEALTPLLAIAHHGAIEGARGTRVSPLARPFAIVALGLGRKRGFDDRVDIEIVKALQDRSRAEREPIAVAGLVYHMLAPSAGMQRFALELARDEDESPSVRCRAVEALQAMPDEAATAEICRRIVDVRLDVRRSAALALGRCDRSVAMPALRAALPAESDPLARGFILISLGKTGGEEARAELMNALVKGDSGMRRWAALALGIEARRVSDEAALAKVRAAVREATGRERNQENLGAYWLASGLARDEESLPVLQAALVYSADGRQRMYAASALALVGGDPAKRVLRARLKMEQQAAVRVAIADALGVLGEAEDVEVVVDMLEQLNQPSLQGLAASAVAANGSAAALNALGELARASTGSNLRKAAAIEGLGMMLAPVPPLTFADVSRAANYTVFNEWIASVFQTTL